MSYCIETYIPIEQENLEIYEIIKDAKKEIQHCEDLQPENIHVIVEITAKKSKGKE